MGQLLARKRCRTSEQENSTKCAGTDPYIPVEVQTRKRRAECKAEVEPKKNKVESLSENLISSSLSGSTVSRKRKAKCEAEVIPKKAKVESPSQSLKGSSLDGSTVSRKRRAKCEAVVIPKKANVESPSQNLKGSSLDGPTVSRKRRAKYEAVVKPKTKFQGWKSAPEDELYDVTYQVSNSRAAFLSKYLEMYNLGSGGNGSVFGGLRKKDVFPVAIKHIPLDDVHYKQVVQNGIEYNLIDEVALMVKVAQGPCPALVRMLDCYELPEEVILVMERPYPAMDLLKYKKSQGGVLKEEKAKVILKQMVEASIQMHNSGVFHRDFKLENVLVEMDHGVPKARVIDFGCGCLVKEGTYDYYAGTFTLAPPEWYSSKAYRAEPTTVYHLGTLLYDLLHRKLFDTLSYLRRKRRVKESLSKECRDFLRCCFAQDPVKRASFVELQSHPWLH